MYKMFKHLSSLLLASFLIAFLFIVQVVHADPNELGLRDQQSGNRAGIVGGANQKNGYLQVRDLIGPATCQYLAISTSIVYGQIPANFLLSSSSITKATFVLDFSAIVGTITASVPGGLNTQLKKIVVEVRNSTASFFVTSDNVYAQIATVTFVTATSTPLYKNRAEFVIPDSGSFKNPKVWITGLAPGGQMDIFMEGLKY